MKYSFLFTSSALLAGAVVVYFGLVPSPTDIGLPEADSDNTAGADSDQESPDQPIVGNILEIGPKSI